MLTLDRIAKNPPKMNMLNKNARNNKMTLNHCSFKDENKPRVVY